jgi:Spy/CpxP family protein refolding chaperone
VAVAVVCALVALASDALFSQGGAARRSRWWRAPCVQQRLALSPEQVRELDAIFSRDLPARLKVHQRIATLDAELQQMIRIAADESTVMRLSESVENLRLQRNTRRHLMLLAMYRVLTPLQRREVNLRSGSLAYDGC